MKNYCFKMKCTLLTMLIMLMSVAAFTFSQGKSNAKDRIQPWPKNLHYWQYKQKPILLLGGSDEDNLFNNPSLMEDNFKKMKLCGANYIRCTLSCRDEGNVWPFAKKDNGLYDLNEFDPKFWDRLENCLREAQAMDVVVQIEIWATFDYYREFWLKNPFNPTLNSNYDSSDAKLVPEWDHHPAEMRNPFFLSVPKLNNDEKVLHYQQAFVNKVLDVSLPYGNVLYCMDNETKAPAEWPHYWADFIHKKAKQQGYEVQLTEMWDAWDLRDEQHSRTYKYPERFSFVDVSQNNWQVGQTHYDNLMWYRNMLVDQPGGVRPMNNVKVYQRQGGGKPNDPIISVDRWWQNVFAGCASTRFHRPDGGIGLDERAQKTIQAAQTLFGEFDIFHSEPKPALLSDREENEAYCLAGGTNYAVYFPTGGEVKLAVPVRDAPYRLRWFDPEKSTFLNAVFSDGDNTPIALKTPDEKQTWFVIVNQ
ncbi:MAG: hypothetical protein AB1656_13290 [Candidatus Omnitrophota bacterium]